MKKYVIAAAIIAVLAAFFLMGRNGGPEIETAAPVYSKAVQAVYATGTVEAAQMIPIAPKVSARIVSLEADEGHVVTAGQMLAQLESEDVRSSLAEAQARMTLAEKDLARSQRLAKSGALSKEGLENAQAAFQTTKAAMERTQAELSYLQLTAPQDGTIIRRDGEIGELASASTPVFWINGGDIVRIETEVDEEDIALVKPDQNVLISADAYPGQIFNGKVQSITPKGDPVARSYRVRVTLDQQTPLMIGMTAETNIITQVKERALMVPLAAVKGNEIWISRGDKFEKAIVKTGIKTDTQIEILEGITEGDSIALRYDDVTGETVDEDRRVCNMGTGC